MFASSFLKDEKVYQQTVFTIVSYIPREALVWSVSEIGRN